jgi:catechol-2,3-dioxygenase
MTRELDHIALNVRDICASIEWYKENLDAQIEYQDDTWAMLLVGGTRLALTLASQHPPHIAFLVKTFAELGDDSRVHRDGSVYIYKNDPDGNTIELIHWREDNE